MSTQVGSPHPPRSIVGYCWPWTVRAGDRVDFMVSADANAGTYHADLVRLICADGLFDAQLFKERVVEAPFTGSYEACQQQTHLGSYVEIASRPQLDPRGSFTVQVMVMPTLLPAGERPRVGGRPLSRDTPVFGDQHLVSRWDNKAQRGWALILDAEGCPTFICGDGISVYRTTLGRPLVQDRWFLVMAVFESATKTVSVHARHVAPFLEGNVCWPETRATERADVTIVHEGVMRFAACNDGPGNGTRFKPGLCFSGRLDRVRLSAGVLNEAQALALSRPTIPAVPPAPLVGFWDFGKGIDSIDVYDLSPNQSHGVTVNLPMRALATVDWDNSARDWRQRPDHYSAIHFHDDDLYDAEWKSDFSYTVPRGLPSGIYAARLRHGASEDHIPFFVAPPRGTAVAPVALLIPTATYTAYTNIEDFTSHFKRKKKVNDGRGGTEVIEEDVSSGILQHAAHAQFLVENVRSLGKGIYANHTDGTLFASASQRHPNLTTKPKGIQWTLSADTLLVDWLESKGIPHDIITDDLLHEEGAELLSRYRVVITGNHPEYYSKRMLDAFGEYKNSGGRIMYLGGNGFCWVTSFHPQLPGAMEVRKHWYSGHYLPYETIHAFDGVPGGFWEENGRAPHRLVGVGLSLSTALTGFSWEGSAAYRRLADSYDPRAAFIFEGVSAEVFGNYGVLGGGAAGQEFDSISVELGTPPQALHLARADNFPSYVSMFDEQYAVNAPTPFCDVVYFETGTGGAVFSAASMCWVGSLGHNHCDNDVSRITENVLRRFIDKTPFPLPKHNEVESESNTNGTASCSES